MIFVKGDPVVDTKGNKGRVVEVNSHWGWFKVEFDKRPSRIYDGTGKRHDVSIKLDLDRNK
jgi:hypothetical protein